MAKPNISNIILPNLVIAKTYKRLGAFIIDLILLRMLVMIPFNKVFENMVQPNLDFTTSIDLIASNTYLLNKIILSTLLMFSLIIGYFAYTEFKFGQSVGKMVFNIFVKDESGDNIKIWQAIVRNLYLIPTIPFIIFWVIDPVMILIKGVRLSETLSKTKTLEEEY